MDLAISTPATTCNPAITNQWGKEINKGLRHPRNEKQRLARLPSGFGQMAGCYIDVSLKYILGGRSVDLNS